MATKVEINANIREGKGKKNKKLRAQSLIPAIIYGRKFKPLSVSIPLLDFKKKVLASEAGHNLIFSLKVTEEGKSKAVPVITQSVQRDPLNDAILHVDFINVIMDEAIKAKIPVELVGIAEGVKNSGGVLVHGLREVEVKCLPGDIPDKFVLDVSKLKINEGLHVSDIKADKKIEILSPAENMIANVSPPTKEEEVAAAAPTAEEAAAAAAAPAVAEAEVTEKAAPGTAPAKPGAAPAKPGAAPAKPGPAKAGEKK